jgi:hypothetical protein
MTIAELLTHRRAHEKNGCVISPGARFDARCAHCRAFDALVADENRRGWHATTADRRFLKSLRIAAD